MATFSERYGYATKGPKLVKAEDLIREAAPESVRAAFLVATEERLQPGPLREIVCKVLRKRPDPGNWSAYPNIWNEVQDLVYGAPWHKFYDIVEAALWSDVLHVSDREAIRDELNEAFAEEDLAWHVEGLQVVLRTGDATDEIVAHAVDVLEEAKRPTSATELRKALHALSKRPEPDTIEAVRSALGAMEATARDITGERTSTLGEILKKHRNDGVLLPVTLNLAFDKIWGYSSDVARHVDETKAPTLEEAVMVVGFVAAALGYLGGKA